MRIRTGALRRLSKALTPTATLFQPSHRQHNGIFQLISTCDPLPSQAVVIIARELALSNVLDDDLARALVWMGVHTLDAHYIVPTRNIVKVKFSRMTRSCAIHDSENSTGRTPPAREA